MSFQTRRMDAKKTKNNDFIQQFNACVCLHSEESKRMRRDTLSRRAAHRCRLDEEDKNCWIKSLFLFSCIHPTGLEWHEGEWINDRIFILGVS